MDTRIDFFSTADTEWNDFAAYMSGARASKVQGFECGVQTDMDYEYGEGGNPHAIKSGNKRYPGKVTLLMTQVVAIWVAAIAAGGDDITDVTFDITGTFRAQGQRPLITMTCSQVRISEAMFRAAQAQKSIQVELPFLSMGCFVVAGT
jgi:hypothetical protein